MSTSTVVISKFPLFSFMNNFFLDKNFLKEKVLTVGLSRGKLCLRAACVQPVPGAGEALLQTGRASCCAFRGRW